MQFFNKDPIYWSLGVSDWGNIIVFKDIQSKKVPAIYIIFEKSNVDKFKKVKFVHFSNIYEIFKSSGVLKEDKFSELKELQL